MNEPDKDNTQQSYVWVYKGGAPDKPVIWYQYADSRQGSVPVDFLHPVDEAHFGHSITIMTDGYAGYNPLSKMPDVGRTPEESLLKPVRAERIPQWLTRWSP